MNNVYVVIKTNRKDKFEHFRMYFRSLEGAENFCIEDVQEWYENHVDGPVPKFDRHATFCPQSVQKDLWIWKVRKMGVWYSIEVHHLFDD